MSVFTVSSMADSQTTTTTTETIITPVVPQQTNAETTEILVNALRQVFGEKDEQQQFINVSRVPMICKQIDKIHSDIEDINLSLNELKLTKRIVYFTCGAVATAVIATVISMFLK